MRILTPNGVLHFKPCTHQKIPSGISGNYIRRQNSRWPDRCNAAARGGRGLESVATQTHLDSWDVLGEGHVLLRDKELLRCSDWKKVMV